MNELVSGFRYSDTYKRNIRGNDCCVYWRVKDGGVCVGWPKADYHECPANENGSGCPLFPTDEELADQKYLRNAKRFKSWLDTEISSLERQIHGRTAIEQARTDIYRQLKTSLHVNLSDLSVFNEMLIGAYYAVTFLSHNGKHCILVSCENITNPNAEGMITLFK